MSFSFREQLDSSFLVMYQAQNKTLMWGELLRDHKSNIFFSGAQCLKAGYKDQTCPLWRI
jgi:hypothetical protein